MTTDQQNTGWGQDGPETVERPNIVTAIIAELREPQRDQRNDGELLAIGLEILRRQIA